MNRPLVEVLTFEGCPVEPGASERGDYVLSCRVYRTDTGLQAQPDERWLCDALRAET
jgi:hypothetical protein